MSFPAEELRTLGLGDLNERELSLLSDCLYQALEFRVGARIMEWLSPAQVDEFEKLVGTDSALDWLHATVPHFKTLTDATRRELLAEMQVRVPEFLSEALRCRGGTTEMD